MTEPDRPPFAAPDDLLEALHRSSDGPTFDAPWQARAFGLVVALHRLDDGFDWMAFQRRLIDEVETAAAPADGPPPDGAGRPTADGDVLGSLFEHAYYEQWLAAFERLLVEDGYLDPDEIQARAVEFATGERTAEEFVEGERHH